MDTREIDIEKKYESCSKNSRIIVTCPHCQDNIIIEKMNCCIFRHGIMKDTNVQMDPHTTKEICDDLANKNLIYGCGKPFRIIIDLTGETTQYIVEICDYI